MASLISWCFLSLCVFVHRIRGDVFLHVPRGSNNRLNTPGGNRRYVDRVFNSQNNAKGGYNVGQKTQNKTTDWYHMQYFMSGVEESVAPTILNLEWTNQHGCGDGDLNCNIVLQYQCRPSGQKDPLREIRNGKLETQPTVWRKKKFRDLSHKERQRKTSATTQKVYNEQWEWFDKCRKRKRNLGLFTADENVKGVTSTYTRQNPNGNRYGYECSEERDYYPYFHPTDWIDIAVLGNVSHCDYYKRESFNTQPKGECMELYNKNADYKENVNTWRHASEYNNKEDCEKNKGKWVTFHNYLEETDLEKSQCTRLPNGRRLIWAIPYRSENVDQFKGNDTEGWKRCLVPLSPPDCRPAPHSRSNHLGNGVGVVTLNYPWKLPYFPSGKEQKCTLRIRYNISTNDYDPIKTFSDSNGADNSPITNDPEVLFGKPDNNNVPLQLAINTAQFGRTFQDRSHVFKIIPRQKHFEDKRIWNLNVRGKRGNIVQTFPAVEYDFAPKRLTINSNDYLHVQWEGSNTNPGGYAGEGRDQTDRSNMVAMEEPDISFPQNGAVSNLFDNAKVIHALDGRHNMTSADIEVSMVTAGTYNDATKVPADLNEFEQCNRQQLAQLDCYPPSYAGLLLQFKKGVYYYMCSRNNNFTNRNQKGRLTVSD